MNSWIVLCVQTFVRPCQRRSAGLRLRRSPEADGSSEVLKLRRMTFLRKMFWRSSWKYLFRSILLKIHDHEAPRSTRPWDDCLFHLHPNPLLERHSLLFVCCACVCAMSVCVFVAPSHFRNAPNPMRAMHVEDKSHRRRRGISDTAVCVASSYICTRHTDIHRFNAQYLYGINKFENEMGEGTHKRMVCAVTPSQYQCTSDEYAVRVLEQHVLQTQHIAR